MKNNLIYGIGIYHIQTKPDPLSVLNIQPFKGRSQVGSHPSHFTAPPPLMMLICCSYQTSRARHVPSLWRGWCWRTCSSCNRTACIFVFTWSCANTEYSSEVFVYQSWCFKWVWMLKQVKTASGEDKTEWKPSRINSNLLSTAFRCAKMLPCAILIQTQTWPLLPSCPDLPPASLPGSCGAYRKSGWQSCGEDPTLDSLIVFNSLEWHSSCHAGGKIHSWLSMENLEFITIGCSKFFMLIR